MILSLVRLLALGKIARVVVVAIHGDTLDIEAGKRYVQMFNPHLEYWESVGVFAEDRTTGDAPTFNAAQMIEWDASIPKLEEWIQQQCVVISENRHSHLEEMAVAYLLHTGLMPDEVELVEQRIGDTVRWWYQKRGTAT